MFVVIGFVIVGVLFMLLSSVSVILIGFVFSLIVVFVE